MIPRQAKCPKHRKNIVRVSSMIPPKIRLITKERSVVCMQASKDFAQEGVNMGRAQVTPYQKPKTPRIWPIFLTKLAILFSFLANILLQYSCLERGRDIPFPLAASVQLCIPNIPNQSVSMQYRINQCNTESLFGKFRNSEISESDLHLYSAQSHGRLKSSEDC